MSEIRASNADMVLRWVLTLLLEDAELVIEIIVLLGFTEIGADCIEREGLQRGISMFTLRN